MAVWDFMEYGASSGFVYKNLTSAYYFNGTTFQQITDVDYPATTVNGVVYLDGYIFVMDAAGLIWNSDLSNPASWSALGFISAQAEPSPGVAIAKYHNYIVALCDRSTQFFYDAGNPVGSPLSVMAQNNALVGCAAGGSVGYCDGTVYWIGKNKSLGRGIYRLNGLQPELVSSPSVDRILNTLGLTTVLAFGFRINGSHFYFLNCISDNLTLVYDVGANLWYSWTFSLAGSTIAITSMSQTNGLVTVVTTAPHGLATSALVQISGATPTDYNISALITVTGTSSFTFEITNTSAAAATGTLIATPYTQQYMPFVSYTYAAQRDLLQHESNGKVYEITPSVTQDLVSGGVGTPIDSMVRTMRIDNNNLDNKLFPAVKLVADEIPTRVWEKHSSDDSQTFSNPRSLDLSSKMPRLNRLGKARRMVFELHHVDNTRCRMQFIELGS